MAGKLNQRVKQYKLTPIASAVALTIFGMSANIYAQQAETKEADKAKQTQQAAPVVEKAPQLETVVVTANRRIEKLGDVPQSITVVSEEDIQRNSVREFVDLINIAPALSISLGTQVGTNSINMRGIGTTSNNLGIEGDVAVIVDDMPYAQPQQAFKDLSDAARIEVLKGPQSTMFGKSSIAGAVVVTTKPIGSGPMKGTTSLFKTSDDEYRISTSMSGRLSENFGLRLFASKTNFPGMLHNISNNTMTNGSGGKTFLAKLQWQITPDLDMIFSPFYDHSLATGNSIAITSMTPGLGYFGGRAFTALSNTAIMKDIPIGPLNRKIRHDSPSGLDSTNRGFGLRFNYLFPDNSPLSGHALTSISTFNKYLSYDFRDNDSIDIDSSYYFLNRAGKPSLISNPPMIHGHADTKSSTQEVRLTSPDVGNFRYLVGLWAARNSVDRDYLRGNPIVKATNYTNYITTSSSLNRSIYANSTWEVAPRHNITSGIRLNNEQSDYTFETIDSLASSAPATATNTGPHFFRAKQHSENAITGKLGYAFNLTPDVMTYVTTSTGHKGVAYDMTSGANNPKVFARMPLAAEKATSIEAGLKANLWNNRATLNAAIFKTKFTDFQTSSTERFSDGSSASVLYSVPALLTKGFEVDGKVLVTRDLLLNASIAFTRATILEWSQAPCIPGVPLDCTIPNVLVPGAFVRDAAGGSMPNAPKWKMSMGGEYTIALQSIPYKAGLNFQTRAQSKALGNINQDPTRTRAGYGTVDLGLSFKHNKGNHKLSFGVKNVFDKHYAAGQTGSSISFTNAIVGQPNITTTGWTPARDAFRYYTVRLDMNY